MNRLYYDVFPTEMGWVGALVSDRGLCRMTLRATPQEASDDLGPQGTQAQHEPIVLKTIRHNVEAYLKGEADALENVTLDLEDAPPFFRAAWEACRTIPRGETRSYAWLAAEAGRPGAFRAAGQAMAKNRLSIVVPCHRVIGSDGGLHCYGGGLDKKARLLELERQANSRQSNSDG